MIYTRWCIGMFAIDECVGVSKLMINGLEILLKVSILDTCISPSVVYRGNPEDVCDSDKSSVDRIRYRDRK
jgi:hypothetical protein